MRVFRRRVLMVGKCETPYRLTHSIQRCERSFESLSCYECQSREGAREHVNAAADPLRRGVFVGPVTHAAAAGNEEHGDRSDARHEERVVIGAADHALAAFTGGLRGLFHGLEDCGIASGRGIGVDHLRRNRDSASLGHFVASGFQLVDHRIAPRAVDVANVGFEAHAGGNAVDGAGKDFADADGSHGVDGAGGLRGSFERENQFGSRGERIFAAGHQLAAGVAAFAFDNDAHAGGRGDVRDEADVDAFLLEDGALARCGVR